MKMSAGSVKMTPEAIDAASEALRLRPDFPVARREFGQMLVSNNRLMEA